MMLRAQVVLTVDNEEIERLDLNSGTPLPIVGEQIEAESGQYTVTDIIHEFDEFEVEDEISEPRIRVHAESDSDANSSTQTK